jgi:hypothetical protein
MLGESNPRRVFDIHVAIVSKAARLAAGSHTVFDRQSQNLLAMRGRGDDMPNDDDHLSRSPQLRANTLRRRHLLRHLRSMKHTQHLDRDFACVAWRFADKLCKRMTKQPRAHRQRHADQNQILRLLRIHVAE